MKKKEGKSSAFWEKEREKQTQERKRERRKAESEDEMKPFSCLRCSLEGSKPALLL